MEPVTTTGAHLLMLMTYGFLNCRLLLPPLSTSTCRLTSASDMGMHSSPSSEIWRVAVGRQRNSRAPTLQTPNPVCEPPPAAAAGQACPRGTSYNAHLQVVADYHLAAEGEVVARDVGDVVPLQVLPAAPRESTSPGEHSASTHNTAASGRSHANEIGQTTNTWRQSLPPLSPPRHPHESLTLSMSGNCLNALPHGA